MSASLSPALLESLRHLAAGRYQPFSDELEAAGLAAWEVTESTPDRESSALRVTALGRMVLEAERLGLARAAEKIEEAKANEIEAARRARRAGAETCARSHDDEAAGLAAAGIIVKVLAGEVVL